MVLVKVCIEYYVCVLGIRRAGHRVNNELFFDTLKITPITCKQADIHSRALDREINLRYYGDGDVSLFWNDDIIHKKAALYHSLP